MRIKLNLVLAEKGKKDHGMICFFYYCYFINIQLAFCRVNAINCIYWTQQFLRNEKVPDDLGKMTFQIRGRRHRHRRFWIWIWKCSRLERRRNSMRFFFHFLPCFVFPENFFIGHAANNILKTRFVSFSLSLSPPIRIFSLSIFALLIVDRLFVPDCFLIADLQVLLLLASSPITVSTYCYIASLLCRIAAGQLVDS